MGAHSPSIEQRSGVPVLLKPNPANFHSSCRKIYCLVRFFRISWKFPLSLSSSSWYMFFHKKLVYKKTVLGCQDSSVDSSRFLRPKKVVAHVKFKYSRETIISFT